MTSNIGVLIIERAGTLKTLCVKTYNESELYKRCGFKADNNFQKQCDWRIIKGDKTYTVSAYGKGVGRIGFENNYKFHSPLNNTPLFGNCVLVLHVEETGHPETNIVMSLDLDFWTNITTTITNRISDVNIRSYINGNVPDPEEEYVAPLENSLPSDEPEDIANNISTIASESDVDSDTSELVEEDYLSE
jgi:hypothetical protein